MKMNLLASQEALRKCLFVSAHKDTFYQVT
jgi:hypothetical protein